MPFAGRIAAGRLRSRVVLQKRVPSVDSEGNATDGWASVGSIWANIEPVSAQEKLAAAQSDVVVTHQVTIRYRTDVTHNHRLLKGTRRFDVQTVTDPGDKHRELQLLCGEVE